MQHPGKQLFGSAQPIRNVRVQAIDIVQGTATYALITDLTTGGEFTVPMSTPNRIKPQVGDLWAVDTALGAWQFRSLLVPARELQAKTLRDAIGHLNDLGLFRYRPEQSVDAMIEAPHAAYIGEVRSFASFSAVPTGWLLCNGQAVSRGRYAALFDKIGTTFGVGDGTTTFNVPSMTVAMARIPSMQFNSSVTAGAASTETAFLTVNPLFKITMPARMIVAVSGAVGNAASAHSVLLSLRDRDSNPLSPFGSRNFYVHSSDSWTAACITAWKDYAVNDIAGFSLSYAVSNGNTNIQATVDVRFEALPQPQIIPPPIGETAVPWPNPVVQAICAF